MDTGTHMESCFASLLLSVVTGKVACDKGEISNRTTEKPAFQFNGLQAVEGDSVSRGESLSVTRESFLPHS